MEYDPFIKSRILICRASCGANLATLRLKFLSNETSPIRNAPPVGLHGVIPPGYQPACTAVMSAAWSAYISTMAFDH